MDRPLTEVQKFIKETQRQIDEEGLVGMSGTHFDRGDPIRRVLKAKQFEYRLYSGGMKEMINPDGTQNRRIRKGKFASVAAIAKDLNAMNEALKNGNFEPLAFDDSQRKDGESCGPNCECYPANGSKPASKEARKIIGDALFKGKSHE